MERPIHRCKGCTRTCVQGRACESSAQASRAVIVRLVRALAGPAVLRRTVLHCAAGLSGAVARACNWLAVRARFVESSADMELLRIAQRQHVERHSS
ncbi:hypothetical protein [Ramlibacter sp.]|uniref:hypothetical protein n=1 Tax=Ramlibacter sp. TaxID=1917967 RepID=UPI003D0BC5FD